MEKNTDKKRHVISYSELNMEPKIVFEGLPEKATCSNEECKYLLLVVKTRLEDSVHLPYSSKSSRSLYWHVMFDFYEYVAKKNYVAAYNVLKRLSDPHGILLAETAEVIIDVLSRLCKE